MRAKIVKTGNSRAIVIPAAIAAELGWEIGDEVELEPMASGLALSHPSRNRRSIASIGRRILRDNIEVFEELAKR
jgi:antitoxin component of MazEF toxin-antitoxin module